MSEETEKITETVVSFKTDSEARELLAGSIVATKYRVISHLGKGGMGSVYRVHQIFLQQDLALKVLSRSGCADEVHMRRFQIEGKAAFNLNHPNLVKVHDFGLLEDQSPYLVMDYVSGKTLANFLKAENGLSVDQAVKIVAQASLGLAYAHQNLVVHRDIKPSNIMLVDGVALDEEGSVKIVDFGIAKVLNAENEMQTLTQTGEVIGSPYYMSPEQCSGGVIDHRTDVYSLGCVLFEILTGTPPHVGSSALRTMMLHQSQGAPTLRQASLGKEFPEALEAIVRKMLDKDPACRYQNLGIVANQLADVSRQDNTVLLDSADARQTAGKGSDRKLVFAACTLVFFAITILSLTNLPDQTGKSNSATQVKPEAIAKIEKNKKIDTTIEPNDAAAAVILKGFSPEILENYSAEIKKAKHFIPVAVEKDGKRKYKFEFPNCGIGFITNQLVETFSNGKIRSQSISAKSTTYVPYSGPYGFKADETYQPQTFANPSVLKLFDTDTLNELSLSRSELVGGETAPLPGETEGTSVEQMLKIATTWKNLQLLQIENLPLTEQAVLELNHMPALRYLGLSNCKMIKEISQQPFLQRITDVSLIECEADDFLKALSKSTKLKMLKLKNTNCSGDSLKSLQRCPSLSSVIISQKTRLNESQFAALLSLRQISKIDLQRTDISADQIAALKRCHWLKKIEFSPRSEKSHYTDKGSTL